MNASFGRSVGYGSGAHSVYATDNPGVGDIPGADVVPGVGIQGVGRIRRNTAWQMLRAARGGMFFGLQFENWLPFTASIVSRFIGPRRPTAAWQSPYGFPGEDITRFGPMPSSDRPFPYPYEIGAVTGFMPMLDQYSMQWAWARNPSGPGVLTPIPIAWQASYPDWQKVSG